MPTTLKHRPLNRKAQTVAEVLDGFEEMIHADMLVQNYYASDDIVSGREEQLCQGRKACAIGSVMISYGVRPFADMSEEYGFTTDEWDTATSEPTQFAQNRPVLRRALSALNRAAKSRIASSDDWANAKAAQWSEPLEGYFESMSPSNEDLTSLVAEARVICVRRGWL